MLASRQRCRPVRIAPGTVASTPLVAATPAKIQAAGGCRPLSPSTTSTPPPSAAAASSIRKTTSASHRAWEPRPAPTSSPTKRCSAIPKPLERSSMIEISAKAMKLWRPIPSGPR